MVTVTRVTMWPIGLKRYNIVNKIHNNIVSSAVFVSIWYLDS
jgi:hypothetical protein